jgi:hypothetical protein
VGSGIGQSLLFLPSLSIIGQHFKRHRAFATGIGVSVRRLVPPEHQCPLNQTIRVHLSAG